MIQKSVVLALAASLVLGSCSPSLVGDSGLVPGSEGQRMIIPGSGTALVETWLQGRADSRLVAGMPAEIIYKGDLGDENIWLHFGINGWKEVKSLPMGKAALLSGGVQAVFVLPAHARSLEFVFVRRDSRGEWWDNNAGRDWKTDVYASVSQATYCEGESPYWEITYLGPLSKPVLHYGVNGWTSPQDVPMLVNGTIERNTGVKSWWVHIPAKAEDSLEWCFTDGQGKWDNNEGRDWRAIRSRIRADLWPSMQSGILYYPDLFGKPVHAFCNGLYAGQSQLVLRHSGAYLYAEFHDLMSGDWVFVLDETVNGVRYYTELRTRLDQNRVNLTLPVILEK